MLSALKPRSTNASTLITLASHHFSCSFYLIRTIFSGPLTEGSFGGTTTTLKCVVAVRDSAVSLSRSSVATFLSVGAIPIPFIGRH